MRRWLPLLPLTLIAAVPSFDWGFRRGLEPLPVQGAPGPDRCGRCHAEVDDWKGSRHHSAWSNDIFQAGYILEPQAFCVNCHAPLPEQGDEIEVNHPWYLAMHPESKAPLPAKQPERKADQGIHCSVCHWREGEVLAPKRSGKAPHPVREAPEMSDPAFCKSCHEFPMPAFHGGEIRVTETPMQSTWTEWAAYAAANGKGTCQSCHMPDGKHTFKGGHDIDLLRASVQVDVAVNGEEAVFTLRSVGVGHHFPTGDLFRNLQLQVKENGEWMTLRRFGREFELTPEGTEIVKRLVQETSLVPGVPQEVPAPRGLPWRLDYHYGAPLDEVAGLVPYDRLVVTLLEGTTP